MSYITALSISGELGFSLLYVQSIPISPPLSVCVFVVCVICMRS